MAADRSRLEILSEVPSGTPVNLLLNGRRIWSFEVPDDRDGQGPCHPAIAWPAILAGRLTGRASLALQQVGHEPGEATDVRFDDVDVDFDLVDESSGAPLCVNKWGRLAQSLDSKAPDLIDDVLSEAERLIALLHRTMGVELFVTGGTLLGPLRDGRVLPQDDDADLAYLSGLDNPSDVVLESFAVERRLSAAGYEVVRHSSAHLQIMFPGGTLTDRFYIDIFTYFVCNGWFYGPFHARQPAEEVTILPLGEIAVNGRQLPAPAEPEQLLAAIYGPSWGTPNPAFRFVTPPSAARRFFWWLNHFDVDRENWEDHHRAEISGGAVPDASDFARYVAARMTKGASVVELGCGVGADAELFAREGLAVIGVDFSRPALLHARSRGSAPGSPDFRTVNLNMTRQAVALRAAVAELPAPHHVYARQLFDALPPLGWDVTLQFISSVLRREADSRAFIEVVVRGRGAVDTWTDYRDVDWKRMLSQLERYGLVVEHLCSAVPGDDGVVVNQAVVMAGRETAAKEIQDRGDR